MKRMLLLLTSALAVGATYAQDPTSTSAHLSNTATVDQNNAQLAKNKALVQDFYQGVFIKHQVKTYADRYIGQQYIQHNPHVADGKAPFVDYFSQYFKANLQAKSTIQRVIAEGDLVMLHVHSQQTPQQRGSAIVDIFRVADGKIVEHWDVQQAIPEPSANTNSMF